MAIPTTERETILRIIESWPLEEQMMLAQAIMQRVRTHSIPLQQPSWREMAGLASTGRAAPSDEDVDQWLDERRLKKHG
jgi:hypothetical protein